VVYGLDEAHLEVDCLFKDDPRLQNGKSHLPVRRQNKTRKRQEKVIPGCTPGELQSFSGSRPPGKSDPRLHTQIHDHQPGLSAESYLSQINELAKHDAAGQSLEQVISLSIHRNDPLQILVTCKDGIDVLGKCDHLRTHNSKGKDKLVSSFWVRQVTRIDERFCSFWALSTFEAPGGTRTLNSSTWTHEWMMHMRIHQRMLDDYFPGRDV